MKKIGEEIYSVRELKQWLQQGKKIVIYGAGKYGKKMIDYLFLIGCQKIKGIVVTQRDKEKEYRGIQIWTADEFFIQNRECHIIIAVSSVYHKEIIQIIRQYDRQYCCMTEQLYSDIKKRLTDSRPIVSYQGIDFLCPGFGKCGTTSLFSALREISSIYLPEHKENHFLQWCDNVENPDKILKENFYDNIREGQKVGMIDPTYAWEAKKTHDFLGDKLKIIFLVRNPVDAAFSGFKMAARQGRADLDRAYQRNGGVFSVEIFEEHFERDKDRFKFIDWIGQFEKYYMKEQLKVVVLEEMVERPRVIINDILDFVGVQERYKYTELPLSNEGGSVMADLEGYKLARLWRQKREANWNMTWLNVEDDKCNMEGLSAEIEEKYANAARIYGAKMEDSQRKKTEMYYNSSVRELEKWMNKDLSRIWF